MNRLLAATFLAAITLPHVGCAVARIDVDVYKGPLANHKQVQLEQMASLAIAAKPVLQVLQDRMAEKLSDFEVEAKDGTTTYNRDEMGRVSKSRYRVFEYLNAILDLYNDRQQPNVGLREAKEALETSKMKQEKLEVLLNDSKEFVDQLKQRLSSDGTEEEAKGLLEKGKASPLAILSFNYASYKETLYENAKPEALAWLKRNFPAVLKDLEKGNLEDIVPTAIVFDALGNEKVAAEWAERILTKGGATDTTKAQGKAIAIALSETYKAQREAGRLVLRATLNTLRGWDAVKIQDPTDRKELLTALAESVKGLILQNYLNDAVTDLKTKLDIKLSDIDQELLKLAKNEKNEYWRKRADAMGALILERPKEIGDDLMAIDNALQFYARTTEQGSTDSARYRYGLAWTPEGGVTAIEAVITGFQRVDTLSSQAISFENGRPKEGLNRLVQNYLDNRKNGNDSEADFKQLQEALIHFAQKLLFFANNEDLIKVEETGLWPPIRDIGTLFYDTDDAEPVLALQSVGNAILSFADDITRQRYFGRRQEKRFAGEVAAIKASLAATPTQVIAAIDAAIDAAVAKAKAAATSRNNAQTTARGALVKSIKDFEEHVAKLGLTPDPQTEEQIKALTNLDPLKNRAGSISEKAPRFEALAALIVEPKDPESEPYKSGKNVREAGQKAATEDSAARDGKSVAHHTALKMREALQELLKNKTKAEKEKSPFKEYEAAEKAIGEWLNEDGSLKTNASELLKKQDGMTWDKVVLLIDGVGKAATKIRTELAAKINSDVETLVKARNTVEANKTKVAEIEAVAKEAKKATKAAQTDIDDPTKPITVPSTKALVIKKLEEAAKETGLSDAQKKTLAEALKLVKATTPPSDTLTYRRQDIAGVNPTNGEAAAKKPDAQAAIDQLIALLRYEYVQAVKAAGKDSDSAKRIKGAIETALLQRADMTFVRSANAYLRSIHTATDLQNNRVGWQWELGKQYLRGTLPFIPYWHDNNSKKNRLRTDIDKQYWQNINRVRVAGGGKVNYAIAKDPIGNWYVKAYSTEKDDIIQSAKNLALFGISAAAGGGDLLNTAADGQVTPRTATTLGRQFEQFTGIFNRDAVSIAEELTAAAPKLQETISTQVGETDAFKAIANDTDMQTAITNALANGFDAVTQTVTSSSKAVEKEEEERKLERADVKAGKATASPLAMYGNATHNILEAIYRYRTDADNALAKIKTERTATNTDVQTEVDAAKTASQRNAEAVKAARAALKAQVRALLTQYLGRQDTVIAQYRNALQVLGATKD